LTLVKEHLKDDGVMVVNMNMKSDMTASDGSGDGINTYLADTISTVFDCVYTVDVRSATNRELFASDNPAIAERLMQQANATQIDGADAEEK